MEEVSFLYRPSEEGYYPEFWQALGVSFLVCAMFHTIMKKLSGRLFPAYNKLSEIDQLDWNTRYIQVLHGLVVPAMGMAVLADSRAFNNPETNKAEVTFPLSSYTMGVSAGAFTYETLVMLSVYPRLGGQEMLVHHVAALCSTFSGGLAQKCHYFIIMLLCTEFTNVFISGRWYLDRAGLRKSRIYIANGVAMFLAWIPVRLVLFLPFYVNFLKHWHEIRALHPLYAFYMCTIPPLLLALNVIWFTKIARGLVKVVLKGQEAAPATRGDSSFIKPNMSKAAAGGAAVAAAVDAAPVKLQAGVKGGQDDAGSNGNASQGIAARWGSDEDLKKAS